MASQYRFTAAQAQSCGLRGSAGSAHDQALGFDTHTVITRKTAEAFAGQGYTFCLRYVSRGSVGRQGDLTAGEAADILAAGLALMPVQQPADAGWLPTAARGNIYGRNAAAAARAIGIPAGVTVWLDLDGVASDSTEQDVLEYCASWYEAVEAAGYLPGLYVGERCGLDDAEPGAVPFQCFWKSPGKAAVIPVGASQMFQSPMDAKVNGMAIDVDQIKLAGKGPAPCWLGPDGAMAAA